jgi:thiol-disulfide isomerase/thioredoxin
MKKIIIALLTIVTFSLPSEAQSFVRELDQKTEKPLLRGQIKFKDIKNESTLKWINADYQAREDVVKKLKVLLPKYRLVVFIGTWCEDTQHLLPQLYRTLEDASYDFNALEMYGVNRRKEGLNAEHLIYNIKYVPTIIVMDRFKEVGRIIESVNTSIEEDLLDILESNQ